MRRITILPFIASVSLSVQHRSENPGKRHHCTVTGNCCACWRTLFRPVVLPAVSMSFQIADTWFEKNQIDGDI
ncbi:uncharacterized protein METZ01_LOCUS66309, partial [marine metagenome]